MSDGDFAEHRRSLIGGIADLASAAKELAREQSKYSAATDATLARVTTRLDAHETWRVDLERRLREDFERRLREVESTRSQALVVAALGSLVFGGLIAALLRLVVR